MATTENTVATEQFVKLFGDAIKTAKLSDADRAAVIDAYRAVHSGARTTARMSAMMTADPDNDAMGGRAVRLARACSDIIASELNTARTRPAVDPIRRNALRVVAAKTAVATLLAYAPADVLTVLKTVTDAKNQTADERDYVAQLAAKIAETAVTAGGTGTREQRRADNGAGRGAGRRHVQSAVAAAKTGDVLTTAELSAHVPTADNADYPAGNNRPTTGAMADVLRTIERKNGTGVVTLNSGDGWHAETRGTGADLAYVAVVA